MEIQGFVYLKKDADCEYAMGTPEDWQGKIHAAIEINEETGSVLLIVDAFMGMFDMKEVILKFHCKVHQKVLIPKGLNFIEESAYIMKRLQRKGGYNLDIKRMVIAASLEKGKLYDDFLF